MKALRVPPKSELLNSLKSFRAIGASTVFVTVRAAGWAMHDFDSDDFGRFAGPAKPGELKLVSGAYPVQEGMDLDLIAQGIADNLSEKLGSSLRPAPA